ncbi:hypothetical protein IQ06DRAFT_242930 [Phaeosphaeriaceae sp. SRC1lsM3a]|nr:hypothetical protein IQ06DRAFT_242930 [Stagonospora sp. SRC1lsM3a]
MGFIVHVHYACRAVFQLLNRLTGLRLVKVEWVRVDGQLRVTLKTNNKQPTAAAIHVTGPGLERARSMKPSTVVRRTMANELLRRRDNPACSDTTLSRRSLHQRADGLHVSFQEQAGQLIGPPSTATQGGTSASTRICVQSGRSGEPSPSDIIGTGPHHLARISTSTKSAGAAHLDSASNNNSVINSSEPIQADSDDCGLPPRGRTTTQPRPSSPQSQFSPTSEAEQHSLDARLRRRSLSQSSVQWVPPPDAPALKFAHSRAKASDGDSTFSPASDRTLFEEPELLSLDRPQPGSPDYFTFDNDVATRTEVMPAPVQRRVRHSRAPSTEPNFNKAKRASLPLRARTKTNEGLLQLQANPSKPERPPHGHERRISLGIPLKPAVQTEGIQRSKFGSLIDTPPQTPKTPRTPRARAPEKSGPAATLRQKERDLEYKHRHTFIGTASLDDFLEVLDVSQEHTTTKAAVGKAFLILASSERLLARQASSTASGWDLVSRTIPDVVNTDYVIQAHVKLGSITLWQFLELIPFDDQEEAGAMSVVEAYSAASHMDSKAGVGATSKAKAFRTWMVNREAKESNC